MSGEAIVAKRYAKALFDVALGQQQVAQVEEQLKLVADSLKSNPEFDKLLRHPNIDTSAKVDMLQAVFQNGVSESVLNTISLLIERGRASILASLTDEYIKIANEALGQAKAVVTSPAPLTEQEQSEIAARFSQLTGKKIVLENVINPALIGGLQVRIGDRLYDGSLSGKLTRLSKSLSASQAL
ncbi:ATP synthase subunit delta [Paenibacillus sp. J31TS4]|uniref:F0F1 ATP synthase subunit delta n=1 Tax=Paenibacillus sp. J31TS4 TaxID=2807195 RepID=UPI001B292CF7|nr:F0F1 ATP synthase subunit delta [Paenibacillus sp. J31TS4]GIP40939.1 ATP synthase subunit delta [Paenibacillus sp. J31TS4]